MKATELKPLRQPVVALGAAMLILAGGCGTRSEEARVRVERASEDAREIAEQTPRPPDTLMKPAKAWFDYCSLLRERCHDAQDEYLKCLDEQTVFDRIFSPCDDLFATAMTRCELALDCFKKFNAGELTVVD